MGGRELTGAPQHTGSPDLPFPAGVPVSAAPVPAPWGHRPGQLPGSPPVHIPGPAGELPSQHGSQPHPDVVSATLGGDKSTSCCSVLVVTWHLGSPAERLPCSLVAQGKAGRHLTAHDLIVPRSKTFQSPASEGSRQSGPSSGHSVEQGTVARGVGNGLCTQENQQHGTCRASTP